MSDYLHQIEERAEYAQRNREMYSKDSLVQLADPQPIGFTAEPGRQETP